jgi:hypothetical protein
MDGRATVTTQMLFASLKSKKGFSLRTVQRIVAENFRWTPLKNSPPVTAADEKKRLAWARSKLRNKKLFGPDTIYLDCHSIKKCNTPRAMDLIERQSVTHTWRKVVDGKLQPPKSWEKKMASKLRFNTGGRFHFAMAASEKRGVFFYHHYTRFSETEAIKMYKALQKRLKELKFKAKYIVQDGDQCWTDIEMPRDLKVPSIIKLPPYSPDLQPLDIAINRAFDADVMMQCKKRLQRGAAKTMSNKAFVKLCCATKVKKQTAAVCRGMRDRLRRVVQGKGALLD